MLHLNLIFAGRCFCITNYNIEIKFDIVIFFDTENLRRKTVFLLDVAYGIILCPDADKNLRNYAKCKNYKNKQNNGDDNFFFFPQMIFQL